MTRPTAEENAFLNKNIIWVSMVFYGRTCKLFCNVLNAVLLKINQINKTLLHIDLIQKTIYIVF